MFFSHGPPDQDEDWQDQTDSHPHAQGKDRQPPNTTQFYQLLEVPKDATTQQIKKAFRKKALKEHPDKGGDPNKFKRLKEAYDCLLDPQKRHLYDQYGQEGVNNGGPPGAGQGFGFPFGQEKGPQKMKPKLVKVQVTLEQIYNGMMKQVTFTRIRGCPDCNATGGNNAKVCGCCNGKGRVMKIVQVGMGMFTQAQAVCEQCGGQGIKVSEEDRCKTCLGKRVTQQQKKLEVAVQQGVPDGHDYIFTGQSDQIPDVMAGDVYARITLLSHQFYQRRGADLVHVKEISLLQAITGVTFTITHLDGKEYTIATAPGEVLSNKQMKTVRRLGMPFYKDPLSFGNLFIEFKVAFPPSGYIYAHQEALIRQAFQYHQINTHEMTQQENSIVLEDFSQDMLNPRAGSGGEQEENEGQGEGIQCQQQ